MKKTSPDDDARALVGELREVLTYPVALARIIAALPAAERQALHRVTRAARDARTAAAALAAE